MERYSFKLINNTPYHLVEIGFDWRNFDDLISLAPDEEKEFTLNYRKSIFNFFGPGSLKFVVLKYKKNGQIQSNNLGGSIPRDRLGTDVVNVFHIDENDIGSNPFQFRITRE